MVGKLDDCLIVRFAAHLRPAEDDFNFRPDVLDGGDDFRRQIDVPDVNAEADDFRIVREQNLRDVERTLVDVKFGEAGAGLQFAEIGQQIAKAKRGVDELRVERG
jgi:hypothetical protein